MAISIGGKIVGGIALWIVGRIIISAIRGVVRRSSEKRHLDPTLQRYLDSVLGLLLQFLLFIALLGVFGVENRVFRRNSGCSGRGHRHGMVRSAL